MYDTLARYYDDLVKDEQAVQDWVHWIQCFSKPCSFLDLACGSGEITKLLYDSGYTMSGLDLSQTMIDAAKKKEENISYFCQDMRDLSAFSCFDAIACLCDSFNYLLSESEVIRFFDEVHKHLNTDGSFFFDTHSKDRLDEFRSEWNETGTFKDGTNYQWSIESEEDWIYQDFAFYMPDGKMKQEHHLQRVYDGNWLQSVMEEKFDIIDVRTDFNHPGIVFGEKYFFVLRKKEVN